jgi:hypothetical protein
MQKLQPLLARKAQRPAALPPWGFAKASREIMPSVPGKGRPRLLFFCCHTVPPCMSIDRPCLPMIPIFVPTFRRSFDSLLSRIQPSKKLPHLSTG